MMNIVPMTCDQHGQLPMSPFITTPAPSPDTATGARRSVPDVPSPTCAHHKASQPHHKHAHPTSPPPSTKCSCTCPPSFQPQHHKPPADPTSAHVWYCKLVSQLQTLRSHPQQAAHLTHTTNSTHTAHYTHTTSSLQPIAHLTHTLHTPQHQNPSNCPPCAHNLKHSRRKHTCTASSQARTNVNTNRALCTAPAATITTPALSPDTATGARRSVPVPSPTCAHHKASQLHHKPTHPTSPLPPLPETPLHLPVVGPPPTQ